MGYARPKPERLAEKLGQIRIALGLSQTEMHRRLGAEEMIAYTQISKYESGRREPSLMILLQYARVAGVHMEALVDDDLDLPKKLPGPVKYGEINRAYVSRSRNKKR
jgi:transcriptional regulator with XRE-family HTH domain